jgi:hypothetical protein
MAAVTALTDWRAVCIDAATNLRLLRARLAGPSPTRCVVPSRYRTPPDSGTLKSRRAAAEDARDEDDSHTAHLTPFHAGTP